MKKLYLCWYPYILYKILIEKMGDEENSYSLLLSDGAADLEPMVPVLRQSGLFEQVEFFSCEPYKYYYDLISPKKNPMSSVQKLFMLSKYYLILMFQQRRFKKIALPFDSSYKSFDKIICSDGDYLINGHLSMNHIEYAISEHARNVYRLNVANRQWVIYTRIRSFLDKARFLSGVGPTSRFCKEIIVNDTTDLKFCIPQKKLTAWNVDEHIAELNAQQKDRIFQLYADAYGLKIDASQTYDMLLTNPLFSDAYLPSEESHIKFYKDIIQKYFRNPVLIKPHPRDTVDYKSSFPECAVVDKNISSEILSFSQDLKFGTVLTLYSTSGASFREKAEKLIVLEDFRTPPDQMESLKAYR